MADPVLPDDLAKYGGAAFVGGLVAMFWRFVNGNTAKLDKAEELFRTETKMALAETKTAMTQLVVGLSEIKATLAANARDIAAHDKEIENLKERIEGQANFYRQQVDLIRAETNAFIAKGGHNG